MQQGCQLPARLDGGGAELAVVDRLDVPAVLEVRFVRRPPRTVENSSRVVVAVVPPGLR